MRRRYVYVLTLSPFERSNAAHVYQVPLFSLLLFGGPLTINHFAGGVTISTGSDPSQNIRLKCWSRIGILSNQLRRLLDARLGEVIENVESGEGGDVMGKEDEVVKAMLALLS